MKLKYTFVVCLLSLLMLLAVDAEGVEALKYIPDSCFSVVTVSNVQNDRGVRWLMDAWINSPRESPLRDLLSTVQAQEISVALFPTEGGEELHMLLVMRLPKGKEVPTELLDNLLETKSGGSLISSSYNGIQITSTTEQGFRDYAAHAAVQDIVLAAATPDILKSSLDGPSIERNAVYKNMRSEISSGQDGLLFINNDGGQFVQFFRPLEDKWGMSLLLSADHIQWMGVSLDFVDSQRVTGKFVFQGKDASHVVDIQDDAEFLGETFKRKFMAEKIEYGSDVQVDGRTVLLNLEISGLEPLWTKLFEQGVLSLFRLEIE
jgi:hypothetical protein